MIRAAVSTLIAFSTGAFAHEARAEYRVFQLVITDTQSTTTRTVIDTLDDIQYRGYHPLRQFEAIAIQDSWMCWGGHGEGVKPCPNPRPQPEAAPSASSSAPAVPAPPAR